MLTLYKRHFVLRSKRDRIIPRYSNRSIYNNFTVHDIDDCLDICKRCSHKHKQDYFIGLGLDVDAIEFYHPIVKKLNKLYYDEKPLFEFLHKVKLVILFMYSYIMS